ncbi:13844_t:CDS:2 [Funneliformis geosporum]|nr:13844_t:CDS:2 [Funneliformis geosporum]
MNKIESLRDELRETKTEIKKLENEQRKSEKKPTSSWKKEVEKHEKEKLIKELRKENGEIKKALKISNELLEKLGIDYEQLEEILKEKNEEQTPGWKSRLFQTAKYVAINGLSFYGGNRYGYQNSSNNTASMVNPPAIACSNPSSLPFTPALNLAAVDTSPISPLQSFYDQVIVNQNQASYNLELHGRSLDHFYEEITSKKREIRSLKKENVRKDILITKITQERDVWANIGAKDVRSLLANERIIQKRTKTALTCKINDLTRRLNTEREIYSKNVDNYNQKIQKLERENTRVKELESDKTSLEQSKENFSKDLDQEKARVKDLEKQVGELAILYGKEKVKNKKLIAGQKIFKERAKDLKRELDTHKCKKIFVNCQEACCLSKYQRLQKIISSLESQLEEKEKALLQQINSSCSLGLKVEELKVNLLISRIQELIRIPNTANQKMAQELAALQKVVDEKDAAFRKELAQVIKVEIQGLKTLFSGAVDNHITQQISTATNYPQIITYRQAFLTDNLKNQNQSLGLSQVEKTQVIFLVILLVANLVGIGLLINKKKKRIKS